MVALNFAHETDAFILRWALGWLGEGFFIERVCFAFHGFKLFDKADKRIDKECAMLSEGKQFGFAGRL